MTASSRRVSMFSDSNLSTLESLVLEVALEDVKNSRHNSDPIKDCEMDSSDFEGIQGLLGNDCCADCESEHTEWASVSFGILLCANCSGLHRYVSGQPWCWVLSS
jgi:Putative GTPase activating protein for Arf